MKFSTRIRYGLRAMIEIAACDQSKGILQKTIAKNQSVSNKYLDHIIQALKTAGLIMNLRGKKSGYILTRPANEITILEIHNAFEPGIYIIDCLMLNKTCKRDTLCPSKSFWNDLNNIIHEHFKSTTLQELVLQHNKALLHDTCLKSNNENTNN